MYEKYVKYESLQRLSLFCFLEYTNTKATITPHNGTFSQEAVVLHILIKNTSLLGRCLLNENKKCSCDLYYVYILCIRNSFLPMKSVVLEKP